MVYVDKLRVYSSKRLWKNGSCRMFADTLDELHDMARRIGMKRAWFQDDERLPHYDLTPSRRKLALVAGAKEVGFRFVANFMKTPKRGHITPDRSQV